MSSFRRGVQELVRGQILAPILRVELARGNWPEFSIPVRPYIEREPDGWFHPSEHADWGARKLALYLRQPEQIEREEATPEKVIAVTQGHFWHDLVGEIFLRNGVLTQTEIPLEDPEHNRKGHTDGLMANGRGYEMKSFNQQYMLKKYVDGMSLQELKPGYYAQAQDYLDMQDLEEMQYLIMGVWYPYPIAEFVVARDDAYIAAQRRKYRQAMEMAELGALPDACCAVRSKEAKACELRYACPIGRMALGA